MNILKDGKNTARISRQLRSKSLIFKPWDLRLKSVCSSTEKELSKWLIDKPLQSFDFPRAFLAEKQKHGFGQKGRFWYSPKGGIWLSAALPLDDNYESSSLLGIAVAVVLIERLNSFSIKANIKWPNDLIVRNKKLAGLLPRLIHRGKKLTTARIGIGLNVNNHVPFEGISLSQIFHERYLNLDFWSAEVILSVDSAMKLLKRPIELIGKAESYLWNSSVTHPKSGEVWEIEGLNMDGSLRVKKGLEKSNWTRY